MWATIKEGKRRPPRGHMVIAHDGEILPLHEWAVRLNIPYETLRNRLHKVMDDRHASGLIPNKLTADEAAHVLRPRRIKRAEYMETHGAPPSIRMTRPTSANPEEHPYYDLSDAKFVALRRFARAENIHMVYIRDVMRDQDLRAELLSRTDEYTPAKEEMKFDKDNKETWWIWLDLYPEGHNE